jgi:hypothetical protein
MLAPALAFAVACGKDRQVASDSALNNDLTLAAQARPAGTMDSISAAERLNGGVAPAPVAAAPVKRTATTTRRTTSSSGTRRSTSGSGRTTGSSGGQVASAPREVEVKHTKRDAAIGAAAGAIIGATTSRDKVKGGIIGAAAGGILGGIIGNNVDKGKKTVP